MHKASLDQRERRFAAGVAAGKSLRQAAKDAGYATSTAEKKAYKILRGPRVQSFLTEALEQAGITAKKIAQPIVDALQAKRTVAIKGPDGEIHLETEYPDIRLQLEGYDRAEKLYGVTLTKQETPPPARGSLTVVIVRASDLKKAKERAERSAVEINPEKTLEFSIARKGNVPTA
jgi:terminase small subunit-like protein